LEKNNANSLLNSKLVYFFYEFWTLVSKI